jgi:hypothetical protein
MRRIAMKTLALAGALALMGAAAQAQAPAKCAGCSEEGLTTVPPAQRLTVGDVFANAAPEVQAVFAILLVATLAALAVWAMSLGKVGEGDARGLAGALGRLKIVRSAGIPLGALAASYILFAGFLGIANVRPAPSITVMAPGWAEAAMAVMLGLLATTVGVLCERHLEARIRRAAA